MKRSKIQGQGMTEYIIIVAVIAVAAIAALKFFGTSLRKGVHDAGEAMGNTVNEGVTNEDDGSSN